MKSKFETKKVIWTAVITAIVTLLVTGVADLIKSKPVLHSVGKGLKWVWVTVFEYELSVWQIILGVIGLVVLLFVISLFGSDSLEVDENYDSNDWLNYTTDTISGIRWKWSWKKNQLDNVYNAIDISPLCPKCGTKMTVEYSFLFSHSANCPRCDHNYNSLRDISKIEKVIIDNVERGLYEKNIIGSNSPK